LRKGESTTPRAWDSSERYRAYKRYHNLSEAVQAIVNKACDSYPNNDEISRFQARHKKYRDLNKDTCSAAILPFYINNDRDFDGEGAMTYCCLKSSGAPTTSSSFSETISSSGDRTAAKNQAARGAAIAIDQERRRLRRKLGIADTQGADLDTIMFSVVLTLETVEVFVHWVEVHADPQQRPTFHMHILMAVAFDDPHAHNHGKIRKCLHLTMEWALGERMDRLRPLYEAIKRYAEEHDPATVHASKKQKTGHH
ncbi:MAG: hypothetical protein Q9184_008586, partial [Pyrenodesmia sp. 2 TL-2023]